MVTYTHNHTRTHAHTHTRTHTHTHTHTTHTHTHSELGTEQSTVKAKEQPSALPLKHLRKLGKQQGDPDELSVDQVWNDHDVIHDGPMRTLIQLVPYGGYNVTKQSHHQTVRMVATMSQNSLTIKQ
jgi:hypothetical protein